ncbi:hypothetical protein BDR06DRAFT_956437, partial [Suillus hirtellus]
MSEASFRLGQAPLTPRQVLQNIFAVSVLISTSTLYAASHMPHHKLHSCRVKLHHLNCHTVRI